MEKFTEGLAVFLGGIALIAFIAVVLALPTQLLWNGCLVDAVDGIHQIGFWQALGLNFLFQILFKNSTNSSKK
jgi:hypothetical protein